MFKRKKDEVDNISRGELRRDFDINGTGSTERSEDAVTVDEEDIILLAGLIYDLDYQVYEILGSKMGRVYGPDRRVEVIALLNKMKSPSGSYELMNDLARISNMARTIKDEAAYTRIMKQYNRIYKDTSELAEKLSRVEMITDELGLRMSSSVKKRFEEMSHKIICIGRTYGSGGSEIGFNIANQLDFNYYDYSIMERVMERLEIEQQGEGDEEKGKSADGNSTYHKDEFGDSTKKARPYGVERTRLALRERLKNFRKYHGLPKKDAVFFNQSRLILELANKEDFVIMGRSASRVLYNAGIPHISIFISAPLDRRVERIRGVYPEFTARQVERLVKTQDAKRKKDYKYFNGIEWGDPEYYDMTINTASYGIKGSVDMIINMIKG